MESPLRLLGLLVLLPSFGFAGTIWVPDDHPTIQAAIVAAENGDEVIVRPGTYVETIDFLGKAIAVRSERGPAVTIIDGNQQGSVVTFANGESPAAVLEGFAISNGTGTTVGDYEYGGGIFCWTASPTITRNTITGNVARRGGGIHCENRSSPTIVGNTITANDGGSSGGGIYCLDDCSPIIRGNTIRGNTATSGCGILCEDRCSPTIASNLITENLGQNGAGIGCFASSPWIVGNVITRNVASGWVPVGGGIGCWDASSPFIGGNLIAENIAEQGGGIDCRSSSAPLILGNTITDNQATWAGGGIYAFEHSSPTVIDTIVWNNPCPGNWEISLGDGFGDPTTLTISYSDVKGGRAAVGLDQNATLHWGPGMIDADPLFVDAAHGDYRLRQDPPQAGVLNPCVDAGDPASPLAEGTTRTDWVPDAGVVDMGFHYSLTQAWAFFRNDAAGTNPEGLTASPPVLGEVWLATVDNTGTGHFVAGIMGYADPLELWLPVAGDYLLIDPLSPGGELLHLSPAFGYGVVTFALALPTDSALVGVTLSAQGAGFGGAGGASLHNAYDFVPRALRRRIRA